MIDNQIPMTPERYREIQEELETLRMQAAPQAVEGWGSGMDDPGFAPVPGFGPDAGGTRAVPMRGRVLALEEKLRRARVIDPGQRDRIYFGAVVKVLDRERNKVVEYTLVGPEELDAESGRISSASPIGRALMGRGVGEAVTIRVPKGELRLEILDFY